MLQRLTSRRQATQDTDNVYDVVVSASDGATSDSQAIAVTVTGVNEAPSTAAATENNSGSEDGPITGTLLAGTDPENQSLTFKAGTTLAVGGTVAINATTGVYTFTPASNFNGPASFSYVLSDGALDSAEKTVNITVAAVNDAPTLTAMAAVVDTVAEGTQAQITFAEIAAQGDEADVDGTVTAFVVRAVTSGTLLIGTSLGTATAWGAGTNDIIDSTHHAYWTGAQDANGTLNAFTVVAKDNGGLEFATSVQVQIGVTALNDAPTLSAMAAEVDAVNEDTQVQITFAEISAQGDESDVDGTVNSFVVKAVTSGTLLIGTSLGTATAFAVGTNDTIDATHHAYWTGAQDANGTLNAFTVVAKDDAGTESATSVQVQVGVNAVNDAPSNSIGNARTVAAGSAVHLNGLAVADADATSLTTTLHVEHGTLTVGSVGGAVVSNSGSATVTLTGTAGQINAALAAENVVYRSDARFIGADTFSMTTSDNGGTGAGGTLTDTDTFAIAVISTAGTRDFNNDQRNDLFFVNDTTHGLAIRELDGSQVIASPQVGTINAAAGWHLAGSGDFNADHNSDFLFLNETTHGVAIWEMNGTQVVSNPQIGTINAAAGGTSRQWETPTETTRPTFCS